MSDIPNTLKQLGLNTKELKIYLSLIQSGPSPVQNISRATSISRSTVYQRIENLRNRGLVNFEQGQKGTVVRAIHPKKLKELIASRVEQSKKLATDFESILPELLQLYQPTTTKTKVMHFEGIEGLRRMIYNYEMEAKSKNLYGYTTIKIENTLGVNFIKKYHKKFIRKEYKDHYILSDNKENQKFLKNIENFKPYKLKRVFVRTLPPKTFDPKVTVSIYDDKYAIMLMKAGKPFGVIIQNLEIANHQMQIFKILWQMAKPVGKNN